MVRTALDIAVIGAGPVGLGLALLAAQSLPHASITVFDARDPQRDVSADPRTLALSLGSVQLLQRLHAWPAASAQPILGIHVSQAAPALPGAQVWMRASDMGVPMLGAVLTYGDVVGALQAAWQAEAAREAGRLSLRLGTRVSTLKALPSGVEVDSGVAERFDLAVVAEGGVFLEQERRPVSHDYRQTAWVGTVTMESAPPGVAFERFTMDGPLALLPLASGGMAPQSRAALVWCTPRDDDPLQGLDDERRRVLLQAQLPREAGRVVSLSPLKDFALGLNAERSLVNGRTVRIGNAAQTLHPVAGQGLNLGLRDAYELVARLRAGGEVERALAGTERARAADRWGMIATTDFLARSFTWREPVAGVARGLGLAALQRATPLKAWLARRMMFGAR